MFWLVGSSVAGISLGLVGIGKAVDTVADYKERKLEDAELTQVVNDPGGNLVHAECKPYQVLNVQRFNNWCLYKQVLPGTKAYRKAWKTFRLDEIDWKQCD